MKIKITKEDIYKANETLMNMSEKEFNDLKNSDIYIHYTEEELNKAGAKALYNYNKRKKWSWFYKLKNKMR